MKEVMSIIRLNKINQTKRALSDAGISSFTATGKVLGRGKGLVDYRILHGAEEGFQEAIEQLGQGPRLVPKRIITVVVPDDKVKIVVDTVIKVNQTGNAGDGKIFIIPVFDSIKVRTGESGDITLD
ncbi:MAG: P-II family nitrogen regulator [Spirochaetes bacterium]|nr:P-II family nitrogen regulator [Spirochaetota bacterium]